MFGPVFSRVIVCTAFERSGWSSVEHALARNGSLARTGGVQRVPQVLRDVLQRPDVQTSRRVLDGAREIRLDRRQAAFAFPAAARPARRPNTQHSRSELPIIRLRP